MTGMNYDIRETIINTQCLYPYFKQNPTIYPHRSFLKLLKAFCIIFVHSLVVLYPKYQHFLPIMSTNYGVLMSWFDLFIFCMQTITFSSNIEYGIINDMLVYMNEIASPVPPSVIVRLRERTDVREILWIKISLNYNFNMANNVEFSSSVCEIWIIKEKLREKVKDPGSRNLEVFEDYKQWKNYHTKWWNQYRNTTAKKQRWSE